MFVLSGFRFLLSAVTDSLLPAQCLNCASVLEQVNALCPDCFSRLHFLRKPLCYRCGLPLVVSEKEMDYCTSCVAAGEHAVLGSSRAAFIYGSVIKSLLLKFKHADRLDLAPRLAQWMAQAGEEFFGESERILVPVPLHWRRLMTRRYNQALVLAEQLSRLSGQKVSNVLKRNKATQSHGGHSQAELRFARFEGAFTVSPKHVQSIKGKKILLVDDVRTTGATLEHCARVLRNAGAVHVDALVVSLVLPPSFSVMEEEEKTEEVYG